MSARWLAILIMTMVMNVAVLADELDSGSEPRNRPVTNEAHQTTPRQGAGLSVNVDPETGEILGYRRAEQSAERLDRRLGDGLSRSDEGLLPMTLPDGSVRVDLQGRFRHLNAARLGSSNEIEQRCVDHVHHLAGFVNLHSVGRVTAQESRRHETD